MHPRTIKHQGKVYVLDRKSTAALQRQAKVKTAMTRDEIFKVVMEETDDEDSANEYAEKYAGNAIFDKLYASTGDVINAVEALETLDGDPDFESLDSDEQDDIIALIIDADIVDSFSFGMHEYTGFRNGDLLVIEAGNAEYVYCPSYEQMEALAVEVVLRDLKDEPWLFDKKFLSQHINEDALRGHLWTNTWNMAYDDLGEMGLSDAIDALESQGFNVDAAYNDDDDLEPDAAQDIVDNLRDDYAEKVTEEHLEDPMSYLEDIYGGEEALRQVVEWGMIDTESAAEEAVSVDGAAPSLATYDGDYTDLQHGVYWRRN